MASESDRVARAGNYVLGLMNDRDRQRAERDLEVDPAFRDAVLRLTERMHAFDHAGSPGGTPDNRWRLVSQHIAELPQMRAVGDGEAKPPVVIHRLERRPYGSRMHSLGGRRGTVIAIALMAAFALGYLVGTWSSSGAFMP
jgi:anti-sigma-K factor RskA